MEQESKTVEESLPAAPTTLPEVKSKTSPLKQSEVAGLAKDIIKEVSLVNLTHAAGNLIR